MKGEKQLRPPPRQLKLDARFRTDFDPLGDADIVTNRVAERGSEARFAECVCSSEEDDREHLRGEDAQEGGERIDGGVGDGGGVGTGDVRGEGEGRRVGHAAGKQAAEIHEVHLQDGARENADEHEREHGDARAGEQPLQAGGAEDGGEEFCPGAQADGGEEKRDAEFAEGEVRIHRHVPDLAPDAAHAAEDERDDKGAAGEAEPDRLRQSGEGDGHRSEGNAEGNADEERDEVRFVEFLERVADGGGGFVEVVGHTDNLRLVAKLQAQAGHCGHLEVGAGDARDGDAEAVVEVEFADGLAEHVAIGDDDAAESERAVGEDEVFVAVPANDALKLIEPRAHADDGETVVAMNHGRVGGNVRFITVADAGDGDARFEAAGDRVEADAFEVRIRDDERAAFERLDLAAVLRGEVGRLASKIDPEDLLEQQQHADDADDGGGISDGVSECGQREAVGRDARECAERLRAGAERRRVRRGAGKDAEHGRRVETREPANEWGAQGPEDHNRRGEHVHPHSLLAQRGEEAGAELQADGEDEQDQAELLHEIERVMIHRFAEVPDDDAREEHPRRAEADSAEPHAPQRHAEHAHEGEHADGVRDGLRLMELEEPAHASGFRR